MVPKSGVPELGYFCSATLCSCAVSCTMVLVSASIDAEFGWKLVPNLTTMTQAHSP